MLMFNLESLEYGYQGICEIYVSVRVGGNFGKFPGNVHCTTTEEQDKLLD